MALGMSTLTVIEQRRHIRRESTAEWNLGIAKRFVIAGKAVWFYALKVLWPVRLAFVYPRWNLDANSFLSWLPLGGLVAGGAILWAWRRQPWARAALFGCGFFVLALLPVLGFFDVYYFRYSYVADHFSYLASMGLVALVVAGFATIIKRRQATVLLSAGVAVLLGWRTWQHSHDFHDSETLWQATLRENPSTALAHNNLGNLYQVSGQLDRALFHLQQAARLEPNYAEVHSNLGIVLERLGRSSDAAVEFAEATRLNPNNRDIQFNLAHALELLGQDAAAIEHARAGMKYGTPTADNYLYLGRLLVKTANYAEAIETLRRAHQAVPTHLHLANELVWLLAACPDPGLRRPDEALRLSEQLCAQTQNRVPELLDTLAACYAASGRFPDAIETARQALHLAEVQQQLSLAASIRSHLDGYEEQRPASYDQRNSAISPR
jgi:tetratricopeptide (TPR) repeat protein